MSNQEQPDIVIHNHGCGSGCGKWLAVFLLLIGVGIAIVMGKYSNQHHDEGARSLNSGLPRTPGKVERHLGTQSVDFGSKDQSREMLQLIESVPGKTDYLITYQTAIDVVFFGVNFDKKTISRMHGRPDGTGTAEQWSGHVVSRLESASGDGSLNDTPKGQSPGTYQHFRP